MGGRDDSRKCREDEILKGTARRWGVIAKEEKRQHEDDGYGNDDDEEDTFESSPHSAITSSRQISPDSSHIGVSNKRSFREDVGTFHQKKHKVF